MPCVVPAPFKIELTHRFANANTDGMRHRLLQTLRQAKFAAGIVAVSALMSGCYAQGNSHFLSSGEIENFLTMGRCEDEAKAKYIDGSSKYSGYECRGKFLWFTTTKRSFYDGKLTSSTGSQ